MPTRRTSPAATTIRRAGRRRRRRSAPAWADGCARASPTGRIRGSGSTSSCRRATPAGLVVFVHGGYWRAFDRGDWSHLAAGPLARGWAVAMPGYVLAPEARIAAITAMIREAVAAAAARGGGADPPGRAFGRRASGGAAGLRRQPAARGGAGAGRAGGADQRARTTCARCCGSELNETLRLDLPEARRRARRCSSVRRGRAGARLGRAPTSGRSSCGRASCSPTSGPGSGVDMRADDRAGAAPFQRDRRADRPGLGAGRGAGRGRAVKTARPGGGDRRRRRRLLGALPSGEGGLDRRDADRALGADQRVELARGGRVPHAERRPERREAAGLHGRRSTASSRRSPGSRAGCT